MKTPDNAIPGFPNHFLTDDSFIFSIRAGRKLSRRWTKRGWTTRIAEGSGVIRIVYHDSLPTAPTPDPRTVIDQLNLARIPGYPRYWSSPEGRIFRVSSGRVVWVSDHLRGFQSYVNIVDEDNKRQCKNVDYLAELAHGSRPASARPEPVEPAET